MQGNKAFRAIVLAASVLASCDSEPTGSAEIFCDALCEARGECEALGPPDDDCIRSCVADRPGLPNISVEGATVYADCIRELDCVEVLSDAAFDACWKRAQTQVETTPHVKSFCQNYCAAIFECGYSRSTDECENIYGMWAPGIIDRMAMCIETPSCAELETCEEQVFNSL